MAQIDYYLATISPFTYMNGTRVEQIAKAHGATLTYKPLDIMGLFGVTGGLPPKDRHINRQEYRLQDMVRRAKLVDLPLNLKPAYWPTNMAPSSYAIIAAQNAGGGDLGAFVHALTRSCWADEKDISETNVIAACLTEAGFDAGLAETDMVNSADTYARNLEEGVAAGVFGAPFFVVDGTERFWGQDRLDDLDAFLAGKL